MKKSLVVLFVLALFLGITGNASAVTYTDTFNTEAQYMSGQWNNGHYTSGYWVSTGWFSGHYVRGHYVPGYWSDGDTINWTFDITGDGYTPGMQEVTGATVTLNFTDDGCDWYESARLNLGSNTFSWEVDSGDRSFTLYSLMTLSDTGMIDAQLTATRGDFYFNYATLTAEATAPVPEPATLVLLGSGLAGLAFYRRKRK